MIHRILWHPIHTNLTLHFIPQIKSACIQYILFALPMNVHMYMSRPRIKCEKQMEQVSTFKKQTNSNATQSCNLQSKLIRWRSKCVLRACIFNPEPITYLVWSAKAVLAHHPFGLLVVSNNNLIERELARQTLLLDQSKILLSLTKKRESWS